MDEGDGGAQGYWPKPSSASLVGKGENSLKLRPNEAAKLFSKTTLQASSVNRG